MRARNDPPEAVARPLGRGLHDPGGLIRNFLRPDPGAPGAAPNAQRSLDRFAQLPELATALRRLPASPRVLIEGCADPGNPEAVRRFLQPHITGEARVQVIDLYDLPKMYALLGLPAPEFAFRIADAAALRRSHPDASVDVVFQDFLLNCAPPTLHDLILREAVRILAPGGLALIGFSDRTSLAGRPALTPAQFRDRYGADWRDDAYDLGDILPGASTEPDAGPGVEGLIVEDQATLTSTVAVPPAGRFEFFREAGEILRLFRAAGFEELATDHQQALDPHGFLCSRHRCLLRKTGGAPLDRR